MGIVGGARRRHLDDGERLHVKGRRRPIAVQGERKGRVDEVGTWFPTFMTLSSTRRKSGPQVFSDSFQILEIYGANTGVY